MESQASSLHSGDYEESHESSSTSGHHKKIHAMFILARPASKRRMTWPSPRKLLQIQQVTSTERVNVLEFWRPGLSKSKLTRSFSRQPKLRTGDVYGALGDPFLIEGQQHCMNETIEDKDMPAICALCHMEDQSGTPVIHFKDTSHPWSVEAATNRLEGISSIYKFTMNPSTDVESPRRFIMQWERQGGSSEDGSEKEYFDIFFIDRQEKRKRRVGSMTSDLIEITAKNRSTLEMLQSIMSSSEPINILDAPSLVPASLEKWLFTKILTCGVWIASEKNWI